MWEQQKKDGIFHGVYEKNMYQLPCMDLKHSILILFIYLFNWVLYLCISYLLAMSLAHVI
jgi:hypothetical protein